MPQQYIPAVTIWRCDHPGCRNEFRETHDDRGVALRRPPDWVSLSIRGPIKSGGGLDITVCPDCADDILSKSGLASLVAKMNEEHAA